MYTIEIIRANGSVEKIVETGNNATNCSLGVDNVEVVQTSPTAEGAARFGHSTVLTIFARRAAQSISSEIEMPVLGLEEPGSPICVDDVPLGKPVTISLAEGRRPGRNGIQALQVINWGLP